jgi:hypothetical protein
MEIDFSEQQVVVNTILFLTSSFRSMISGQALGVDWHTETYSNF